MARTTARQSPGDSGIQKTTVASGGAPQQLLVQRVLGLAKKTPTVPSLGWSAPQLVLTGQLFLQTSSPTTPSQWVSTGLRNVVTEGATKPMTGSAMWTRLAAEWTRTARPGSFAI